MKKISNTKKGSTLIEMLIYIALVSIFISGVIIFAWDVVYARQKSFQSQIISQGTRIALSMISIDLENSTNFQINSTTNVLLTRIDGSQVNYYESSGTIYKSINGSSPTPITTNQLKVDNLLFQEVGEQNISKSLYVSIQTSQTQNIGSSSYRSEANMNTTIDINSPFNQARNLITDFSNTQVSANQIVTANFENISSNPITIDKMIVSWDNPDPGEQLNAVQIGSGTLEWSGSAESGQEVDLTDYQILDNSQAILNYLEFNFSPQDRIISLNIYLSDGSIAFGKLNLTGPPPTPTPTPAPTSCNEACQNLEYTAGTCRANVGSCNQNNETNVPGADQYCTGGGQVDTCCCQP